MRLSNSDLLFLGISAFFSAALLTLFFLDTPKSRAGKDGKPVGEIVFKKKTAERKSESEVIWESVQRTATLFNGDSIRTVPEAEAVIRLQDGTEINLIDESLIVLDLSSESVNINFLHGNISAKKSEGGSQVRLKTADGTVSLGTAKGEVSVSKEENKEGMKLVVSEGKAEVTSKGGKATVEEGKSATISADSDKIRVVAASLRATSPEVNAYALSSAPSKDLTFSWKNPDNLSVELVLAEDRDMKKIETRRVSEGESGSLETRVGVHFWQVRERNAAKSETELTRSEARRIEVLRDPGLRPLSPQPGEAFRYFQRAPVIQLAWSENPLAEKYILSVASDADFKEVVYRKETRETRLSLVKLSEGRWYWKVAWNIELPGLSERFETPVQSFAVEKEASPVPPAPVSPSGTPVLRYEDFTNQGLLLSWTAGRELAKYRLEMSEDPAFEKGVIRREMPENFLALREGLKPGQWNWRVVLLAKMEDDSILTVPSSARSFSVLPPEPVATKKSTSENQVAVGAISNVTNISVTNAAVVSNAVSNAVTNAVRTNEIKPVLPVIRESLPVRTNDNAQLFLRLSPADALVELRNLTSNDSVKTTLGGMELPPGEYLITGQKRGHHPFELRFLLTNRESRELRIALREILTESEKLILVDGTSVSGRIVEQNADEIVIETAAGQRKIPRDDVENVIYIRKK